MAKTESTPRGLQKTFLLALFVAYLAQAVFSVMGLFQFHLEANSALAFYLNVGELVLLPLVAFFAAWIISPRQISKLGRAFESGVLAVSCYAAMTFVGTVATVLPLGDWLYVYPFSPYLMIPVVVTVIYIGALLALRATKRWK